MASTNHFVDYGQNAEDHRSLLVLVRHIGSALSSQVFNCAFEKISRINGIHVEGQKRNIVINYRKSYSSEFNTWGDFQAHRKVLGLISIGKCSEQDEFEDLFNNYRRIKGDYSSSIINSRFIVFGMNTDGTPICEDRNDDEDEGIESECGENSTCDNKNNLKSSNGINNNSKPSSTKSANGNLAPLAEQEEDSEITPQQSPPQTPTSSKPSKKNTVSAKGSVIENSPRPVGRQHSNSLTKESSGAEIVFYPNLDKSTDFEDRIKEFVTSLFYVLEGKRLDRSYERNEKLTLLCAPFERKDFVGVDTDTKSFRKKCMGRLRKHSGDLCLQASMPGEAILHYNTALDMLKSVNDFLWMAGCLEGLCCSSIILSFPKESVGGLRRNHSFQTKSAIDSLETKSRSGSSYANGLDTLAEMTPHQILSQDDVIDKYKEAITLYSKFKNAAVIEMEASLKACRFLIQHCRYLQASDFLQNVVCISLPSQEDDKIQRFNTLSNLYHQIGFKRKSAFFKRISGMHCTVPGSSPNWSQCYDLLLQCLEGYCLSVDPAEMGGKALPQGWPVLQYRVLHELVFAARRNGNSQVAVRHMSLLVQRMLPHLTVADQREALSSLTALTAKCPGTSKALALDTGLILPPVSLLALPIVRSFTLLPPPPHLQPHAVEGMSSDSTAGVFIFTPLSLSSAKTDDSRPDFKWVCGDVCEVSLQLANPLMDELKVSHMRLMTSDLETEVFSASPVVPAASKSKSSLVKLEVMPREAGMLKFVGYSTEVFGVKSSCRLRDLLHLKPSPLPEISVEVIPSLPRVALTCSLPKPASSPASSVSHRNSGGINVVTTGTAILFAGESLECVLTLENTSEVAVESLCVWLETKRDSKEAMSKMVQWSEENIQAQLPLQPGRTLCFSLCIHGDSYFLAPITRGLRTSKSGADSTEGGKSLAASLCLKYSGGEGLHAGYCRKSCLGLSVDVVPSLVITHWDVQSASSPTHNRLSLDLVNLSGHPMTVQYGTDHLIKLEPQNTKRISVEVHRLDPSQVATSRSASQQEECESAHIPSFYHTHPLPDPYSTCLGDGLDIRWTIPSTRATGKVCVDYMTWTPQQVSLLLVSDISWDVHLNARPFSPSLKPRFDVGQVLVLSLVVEALRDPWPMDAYVCVEVFQTEGTGDTPVPQDTFAVIGSAVCPVHQPGQEMDQHTVAHSCSFSFFYPGSYYFKIFFTSSSSSSSTSPSSPTSSSLASSSLLTQPPSSLSSSQLSRTPPSSLQFAPTTSSSSTSSSSSSTAHSSSTASHSLSSHSSLSATTATSARATGRHANNYRWSNSNATTATTATTNNDNNAGNGPIRPGWHFGSLVRFDIS